MATFFDAHTHPQFPLYDADREAVMSRARAAGVKMIVVGTQYATSEAAIALAKQYPGEVWATAGFHPNHLAEAWHHDKNEQGEAVPETFDPERLRLLAQEKLVVAIGECGLDFFRLAGEKIEEQKERQKEVLRAHIAIAHEAGKPLMIHCRSAFPELIALLKEERANLNQEPGIIHFFTGMKEDAKELLELGFSFTFGGVVTFSRDYDEVIGLIPPERILSETDAPYVSPLPYRGKRNEPAYVVETVKKLAELKGVSVEMMSETIWKNAKRIFRFG